MNKIGISTLNSYRGSQIFEALGLKQILSINILKIPLQELKELVYMLLKRKSVKE